MSCRKSSEDSNSKKNSNPPSETNQQEALNSNNTNTDNNSNKLDTSPAESQTIVSVILQEGDKGDAVLEMQKKLYCIGYDISIDGLFGSSTAKYLSNFQKKYNLHDTGNYTDETKSKLYTLSEVRKLPSSTKSSDPTKTTPPVKPSPDPVVPSLTKVPDILTDPGDSQQVIVVLANSYNTYQVSVKAYEKTGGSWVLFNSCNGVIGKKGFNENKYEGDLTTPTGKYGFPFIFGQVSNPGFRLPYRIAGANDYWVSNKILEEYNVWMHYDGSDPKERLYSYESLWKIPVYKYAAVTDYNYGTGKVLGKGSAIFMHISPSNGGGTLGCIAMSESNLLKTLKWMDPSKGPIIIMGVKGKI